MTEPLVFEMALPAPHLLLPHLPQQGLIFLDSASRGSLARYSFIAFDPFQTLVSKGGKTWLNNRRVSENPFQILERELNKFHLSFNHNLPPFQGGVAGMLGYELSTYLEKIPVSQLDDLAYPQMLLGFYDLVFAWDHQQNKAWIFSSGLGNQTGRQGERASKRLLWAKKLIKEVPVSLSSIKVEKIVSTFSAFEYQQAVKRAIEYIRAGDIFQVNLSQRFSAYLPKELSAWSIYQRLRDGNPAPFAAFLSYAPYYLASASPERFLQLRHNQVESRPIKGTKSRARESSQDQAQASALQKSEKERAENIMIVDLMRNDLSRVCLAHSVQVPKLCGLESFASVHHLVSVIEGTLQPGKTAIDLLKATFPGGSITGAPKIRAMEIIAEIEPTQRGPYCGSIGYIGFNGDMDFSITIRTFAIRDQFITFQAGGAVTIESDPQQEYEETLIKASALRQVLLE